VEEIPDACTLPTAERPVRVAEFDAFFESVHKVTRPQPTRLDLLVPRDAFSLSNSAMRGRMWRCASAFRPHTSRYSTRCRRVPTGPARSGGLHSPELHAALEDCLDEGDVTHGGVPFEGARSHAQLTAETLDVQGEFDKLAARP
jgi:hypothetical protein